MPYLRQTKRNVDEKTHPFTLKLQPKEWKRMHNQLELSKNFYNELLQRMNMLQNHNLAKSISDASWEIFIRKLSCKAESANLKVIGVPPQDTSRRCSNCGAEKKMPLSERVYRCDSCHLKIDRDINASINILQKATTVGHTGSQARGGDLRPTRTVSNESRTNPANAGEAHTL